MPDDGCSDILILRNTEARRLAGRVWNLHGQRYRFMSYDRRHPGQPPWRSGAEGKAFPLLDPDGTVAAYIKFFTRATRKRLTRTEWLIRRQLHARLPALVAAPVLWADTRRVSRPRGVDFDFTGALAQAVPGETWLEVKSRISRGEARLSRELRFRGILDLIRALAVLETLGIVHGDLSPNNVVFDRSAIAGHPTLYLIDFDAFVARTLEVDRRVTLAEGGTFGTDGYCPPDLARRAAAHDESVAPYSDRYGRDMLLLELLFFGHDLSPDNPPLMWNIDLLKQRFLTLMARLRSMRLRAFEHLEPPGVFTRRERERPSSIELARRLRLALPAAEMLPPEAIRLPRPLVPPATRTDTAPRPADRGRRTRWRRRAVAWASLALLALVGAGALLKLSIGPRPSPASSYWLEWEELISFPSMRVSHLALGPDGSAIAGHGSGPDLQLWKIKEGHRLSLESAHPAGVLAVAFAPGEPTVVSVGRGGGIVRWLNDAAVERSVRPGFGGDTEGAAISLMALSADARILATGYRDGGVEIGPVEGESTRGPQGHTGAVRALSFSPDGQLLASGGADGLVLLWKIVESGLHGEPLGGQLAAVSTLAFNVDGKLLARANSDGSVALWDAPGRTLIRELVPSTRTVTSLAFDARGEILASGGVDETVRLWSVANGSLLRELPGPGGMVTGLAFAARAPSLLVGVGSKGTIRLWGRPPAPPFPYRSSRFEVTPVPRPDPPNRPPSVEAIRLDPAAPRAGESLQVALSGRDPDDDPIHFEFRVGARGDWRRAAVDGMVSVPNLEASRLTLAFRAVDTHGLASSPVSRVIVVAPAAFPWGELEERRIVLRGADPGEHWALFGPGLATAATRTPDRPGKIVIWRLSDGTVLRELDTGPIGSEPDPRMAFSPDGSRLACAIPGAVRIWSLPDGKPVSELRGFTGSVRCLAFSPDGSTVATFDGASRAIELWRVTDGEPRGVLPRLPFSIHELAFSPDGQQLATAAVDHALRMLRLPEGAISTWYTDVGQLNFGPEWAVLARSSGGHVELVRTADGAVIGALEAREEQVEHCAFGLEGRLLAGAGPGSEILLWDLDTHEQLGRLEGHDASVVALSFHPTRAELASASRDGTIRFWGTAPKDVARRGQPPDERSPEAREWVEPVDTHSRPAVRVAHFEPAFPVDGGTLEIILAGTSPHGESLVFEFRRGAEREWRPIEGTELHLEDVPGDSLTLEFRARDPAGRTSRAVRRTWSVAPTWHETHSLEGHGGTVWAVAFRPDGKVLASAGSDRTIRLWRVPGGSRYGRPLDDHTAPIVCVAFSPNGRFLAAGGSDGSIWLRRTSALSRPDILEAHRGTVVGLAFSADGKHLVSSARDDQVLLWTLSGRPIRARTFGRFDRDQAIFALTLRGDGTRLITGHRDDSARAWVFPDPSESPSPMFRAASPVVDLAVGPDDDFLAGGLWSSDIELWRLSDGTRLGTLETPAGDVHALAFHPHENLLASGGSDGRIHLWDVEGRSHLRALEGDDGAVLDLEFGPDGKALASCGEQGNVRLWRLRATVNRPQPPWRGPEPEIRGAEPDWTAGLKRQVVRSGERLHCVAFDPITGRAVGVSNAARNRVRAVGEEPVTMTERPAHFSDIEGLIFSHDGQIVATRSLDRLVKLWGPDLAPLRTVQESPRAPLASLAFSTDDATLAGGAPGGGVVIWRVSDGAQLMRLGEEGPVASSLVFGPDGDTLAAGGTDGSVTLWRISRRERLRASEGHRGPVSSLAFSHDGAILASGGLDSTIRRWRVVTGEELGVSRAHDGPVLDLSSHPAWNVLASSGADGFVRLWRLSTGEAIAALGDHGLEEHRNRVLGVAFSADGRALLSAYAEGELVRWVFEPPR